MAEEFGKDRSSALLGARQKPTTGILKGSWVKDFSLAGYAGAALNALGTRGALQAVKRELTTIGVPQCSRAGTNEIGHILGRAPTITYSMKQKLPDLAHGNAWGG